MTEKLYDAYAYLKTFAARVESCTPISGGCFEVILNRTAFYPEGGGQPCDTGVLNFANVMDVQERGGEIVHTVDRALTEGETIFGGVNWERRFRLMQQHTGEHIVSGIANRLFGFANVGFHMSENSMTVDWDGEAGEDRLAVIERLANEAVYRDLPVTAFYPSADELKKLHYRSKKELEGRVRIVQVPGVDVCACCGTHVARTGEIGAIKLLSSQRYKGGTRITMACGAQAMEDYSRKQGSVSRISALLSAKPEEVAEAVGALQNEITSLKKEASLLRERIFQMKADSVPENSKNICLFEEGLAPEEMRRFALLLAGRCTGTASVFCAGGAGAFRYVLASAAVDVRPQAKALNAAFSGRGGGPSGLAQGSVKGTREQINAFFSERQWLIFT